MEASPTTIKEVIELYNEKEDFFKENFVSFNDLLSLVFNANHFEDSFMGSTNGQENDDSEEE